MKKSLPGPRLTRRFGGPSAAAFGGRGGFRLPGSNVRTVAQFFYQCTSSHIVMRSCSVACARSGRTACMCGTCTCRSAVAACNALRACVVAFKHHAPAADKLRPLPAKRPVIEVPNSIELVSKVDAQCAMQQWARVYKRGAVPVNENLLLVSPLTQMAPAHRKLSTVPPID